MKTSCKELLAQRGHLVLDGPMGTELERRGYDVNDALWSAKFLKENPAAIRNIHCDYLAAGADIITCASYQASIPGFIEHGCTEKEAQELIVRSIQIAQEARDEWWAAEGKASGRPYPLVAGSIGPYGAYLADGSEYTGAYDLTENEYRAFHLPRMKLLLDAGADLFAVETIPRLDEALACAHMLEELGAEYWISFSFRNSKQINDGTPIGKVAASLHDLPHLIAVGVNCTPPEYVAEILHGFRAVTALPTVAYPNSGEVYDGIQKIWLGTPDGLTFAERVADWVNHGAALLGGCCRTRPEDIRYIADVLEKGARESHHGAEP